MNHKENMEQMKVVVDECKHDRDTQDSEGGHTNKEIREINEMK